MLESREAAAMLLPQLGGIGCLSMLRQMLRGGCRCVGVRWCLFVAGPEHWCPCPGTHALVYM